MSNDTIHQEQEEFDSATQHEIAQAIVSAEESGHLMGLEAPTFRSHTFLPTGGGDVYARVITRQLNHLAKSLGVLGFQVLYKEDSFKPDASKPDHGYFQIRVFANTPEEQAEVLETADASAS